jgi:serine/threonine protein kinase
MSQLVVNSLVNDRYLIVQPTDADPNCEVYLAIDQRQGSAVTLRRLTGIDPSYTPVVRSKAEALQNAVHPVLPKVSDSFAADGHEFVVTEQIAGDSLESRLMATGKAFPASWVMFWADQLLDSLAYLHSHKPPIVHGSVGLNAIKLSDDNHAIFADLGKGIGDRDADERGDVFALSAGLYRLLTLADVSPEAMRLGEMASTGKDPVRLASEINPDVAQGVAEVIGRGTSISPNERFDTAVAMQKALRRAYSDSKTATTEAKTEVLTNVPAASTGGSTTMDATITDAKPFVTAKDILQSQLKTEVLGAEERAAMIAEAQMSPSSAATTGQVPTPPSTPHSAPKPSPPTTAAAAKKSPSRKNGSKFAVILGLLFGAFILLGTVAAGAWYGFQYYQQSRGVAANNDASPTPTPVSTPTPVATPTATPDDGSNSNMGGVNSNAATPSTTPAADRPVVTQPTPRTRVTPQNQPTPRQAPRQQSTPAPKPTPKPKDDRTIILQ